MHAPEIVVRQFKIGWLLERGDLQPERTGIGKHGPCGAAFARRIDALQHDQKRLFLFGVENILQPVDLTRVFVGAGARDMLIGEKTLIPGWNVFQFECLARFGDDMVHAVFAGGDFNSHVVILQ